MEDWWGLYRWWSACRKSHKHGVRFFFFFSKKHKQQQLTPPPPFFSFPQDHKTLSRPANHDQMILSCFNNTLDPFRCAIFLH